MPQTKLRVVLDTNVIVRAFINVASESGHILKACERRNLVPLLSHAVLDEYRLTLADEELIERYPTLTRPDIVPALERLMYVADFFRAVRARFDYPRDPKDAPFIELAIAGAATHLISSDKDLLSIPSGRSEASRRFRQRCPNIEILTPREFVATYMGEASVS